MSARSHSETSHRINTGAAAVGLGTTLAMTAAGYGTGASVLTGVLAGLTAGKVGHVLNGTVGKAPKKDISVTAADAVVGTFSYLAALALEATSPISWGLGALAASWGVRPVRTIGL